MRNAEVDIKHIPTSPCYRHFTMRPHAISIRERVTMLSWTWLNLSTSIFAGIKHSGREAAGFLSEREACPASWQAQWTHHCLRPAHHPQDHRLGRVWYSAAGGMDQWRWRKGRQERERKETRIHGDFLSHHEALSLWEDKPPYYNEANGLLTSRHLTNNLCLMVVMRYVCCLTLSNVK